MDLKERKAHYRRLLLGIIAESYVMRRCAPSDFGMLMDQQALQIKNVIDEIFLLIESPERNGVMK